MLSSAHADIILVARITWTLVNKHISGPLHAFVSMRHTFQFPGGYSGYKFSTRHHVIWFWKISVKILLVQAIPTGRASSEGEIGSGPGSGLCARFTNPWHSTLPQFASLPREELGNMANPSLNSKSLIRAWARNDFNHREPNWPALHNIFLTGEVETTSKIGPGWSKWSEQSLTTVTRTAEKRTGGENDPFPRLARPSVA